jgi:hypothetical protein
MVIHIAAIAHHIMLHAKNIVTHAMNVGLTVIKKSIVRYVIDRIIRLW